MILSNEEVKLLVANALGGNSCSQLHLGDYYKKLKNHKIALNWYRKSAENNNIEALFEVAEAYIFGNGIEKDRTKAFNYCKKAAVKGHTYAQYELGSFYNHGIQCKCTRDIPKAINWYKKAAKNGILEAYYRLGIIYEEQNLIINALKWYCLPAKENHANAQNRMGMCYKKLADDEE